MIIENNEKPLERVMDNAYKSLAQIAGADLILGTPISTEEGTTIIPISKISMGFLTGGGEYAVAVREVREYPFAGGSGTGISVTPIAFLVCSKGKVKIVRMEEKSAFDSVISIIPDLVKGLKGNKNENK